MTSQPAHTPETKPRLRTRIAVGTVVVALGGCGGHPAVPSPAGDATHGFLVGKNAFTQPIAQLTKEETDAFIAGRTLFVQPWVQAPASTQSRDGLGPLFNARSCDACHPHNGRASVLEQNGSLGIGLLFRVGSLEGPDPVYGGQLQGFALPDVPVEVRMTRSLEPMPASPWGLQKPSYQGEAWGYGPLDPSSGVSPRIGGALAGMGLVEAVPVERWISLADPEDRDGDGISGRVHWVQPVAGQPPKMGRFGWKAEMPDLRTQVATAFHEDMGLTTPVDPSPPCSPVQRICLETPSGGEPEVDDRALEQTTRYVQLLAIPRSPSRMAAQRWYDNLARFEAIGCADCHVPAHWTASEQDGALRPLADIEIWPFTDLLLHDMGPDLADTRPLPGASPQEWRTPPLWGLGHYRSVNGHQFLLHDGRADGVAQAIAWHGGEGAASRAAFFALPAHEQQEIIAFLEQI